MRVPAYACEHEEHAGDRRIPTGRERFEVVGFEHDRGGGGTNHVELRRRTGVVWCADCVDREKVRRDFGGDQGRLV